MLFDHKHINNAWYHKTHSLIGTPYLAIVASNVLEWRNTSVFKHLIISCGKVMFSAISVCLCGIPLDTSLPVMWLISLRSHLGPSSSWEPCTSPYRDLPPPKLLVDAWMLTDASVQSFSFSLSFWQNYRLEPQSGVCTPFWKFWIRHCLSLLAKKAFL